MRGGAPRFVGGGGACLGGHALQGGGLVGIQHLADRCGRACLRRPSAVLGPSIGQPHGLRGSCRDVVVARPAVKPPWANPMACAVHAA